jgi:ElaB/YqjD/DUF883 family membrane-anchored ribosome-binding protein
MERLAALAQGGDATAMAEFQSAAERFLELSRTMYASGDQYTSDFYRVIELTKSLENVADSQVSIAEQSLSVMKEQVKGLLKLDTTMMTVVEAIHRLNSAAASPIDDIYKAVLGRNADAGGKAFWQEKIASGVPLTEVRDHLMNSNEYKLRGLYQSVLGRSADQAGLEQWLGAMDSGNWTLEQVKQAFMDSDEYKSRLPQAPIANIGTIVPPVTTTPPNGTTPEDRGYLSFDKYKSGNDALVYEIKALREEVKTLRAEQEEQTNRQIGANYDANIAAAKEIVEGTQDGLSATNWKNTTGVELA